MASSDSELATQVSLIPPPTGAAAFLFAGNSFTGLAEILELAEAVATLSGGAFDIRGHRPDGRPDPTGVVKGWSVDRAAAILSEAGIGHFYLSAGGDVIVVAENRRNVGTHGDAGGAGEGGEVQDQCRVLAAGQRQGVGQHHAALGVGVLDLDGGAVAGGDDVVRLVGAAADVVFRQRQPAVNGVFCTAAAQRQQGAECHRAALHVLVHAVHVFRRLDVDAAGVEADALADQCQAIAAAALRPVFQVDDAGVLRRAGLAHGQEGAGLPAGGGGRFGGLLHTSPRGDPNQRQLCVHRSSRSGKRAGTCRRRTFEQ